MKYRCQLWFKNYNIGSMLIRRFYITEHQNTMKKIITLLLIVLFQSELTAQNGNYANVNGVKIYYETCGNGQPLVLLHPFSGSHKLWDQWIDSLSQDYQLIVPYLRGHGNSSNPSKIFRHDDSAKDIYALMDNLNISEFNAIGVSTGAGILIHMATMDSTKISSMILVGASPFISEQEREHEKNQTFESYSEEDLSWLREHSPKGDDQIKMLIDQYRSFAYSYDDINFTPPYLSQIKCPTLIINGDNDEYYPVEIPVEMYKAIPNSSLWIIPNGGHLPIWQKLWSDQFLKVSKSFLADEF